MPLSDRDLTTSDEDELFRPALAGVERPLAAEGGRPWRLGSQLYVGFCGGPVAATAIAWLNADRLGVSRGDRLLIAGVGALGTARNFVDFANRSGAYDDVARYLKSSEVKAWRK